MIPITHVRQFAILYLGLGLLIIYFAVDYIFLSIYVVILLLFAILFSLQINNLLAVLKARSFLTQTQLYMTASHIFLEFGLFSFYFYKNIVLDYLALPITVYCWMARIICRWHTFFKCLTYPYFESAGTCQLQSRKPQFGSD